MSAEIARRLLSRLTPSAFAAFTEAMFQSDEEPLAAFRNAGNGVFVRPLRSSYGGSLHEVFVRHWTCGVQSTPSLNSITRDPFLRSTLRRIRSIYGNQLGAWGMVSPYIVPAKQLQSLAFLTNITGNAKDDYETEIVPRYAAAARKCGLRPPLVLVGSYDSYVDKVLGKTSSTLLDLLSRHSDGVRIACENETFSVQRYEVEGSLTGAIQRSEAVAYEPVYILSPQPGDDLLREFEHLLNSNAEESRLEAFLSANFRQVFGQKYDRIETQLWLKYPELDIAGRTRRTDLFMRNSITNDWELLELKRPDTRLATAYRSVPNLSRDVMGGVEQLRNYARILAQQSVRDSLRRRGIEYFQPDLTLVVGRSPTISVAQWRWLVSSIHDVQVTTYGSLLDELRVRGAERGANW
ncbi:DUF4263 domain-containing protein [Roseateles amylovorans]|uniref:DUF4263 domain-containing protein n=1 Tax=Roseateles amylovorans TaxID=2978473 RepID=A0ABY6AT66_9BURK|nr:DUF4263 domain-containing protein [Roseateles amylovorans]UXH76212.1 DUF4263 domain-containing protein [Roseateles amylovorans]